MAGLVAWVRSWRRRETPGACFVTWRLAPGQALLQPREREIVFRTIRHGHGSRYHLMAFVVMDDHVHVLVRGTATAAARLARSWQASAGHQIQRIHLRQGEIWNERALVTILRDDEDMRERAYRILGNPWKRWPFVQRYPWVWDGIEN